MSLLLEQYSQLMLLFNVHQRMKQCEVFSRPAVFNSEVRRRQLKMEPRLEDHIPLILKMELRGTVLVVETHVRTNTISTLPLCFLRTYNIVRFLGF
nr:hypothetical protein Itr_chr03CG23210 [Ipomoea trifida]